MELAREGLISEIPEGWNPCITQEGELIYFNFQEGEGIQEHPIDYILRQRVMEAKGGVSGQTSEQKPSQPTSGAKGQGESQEIPQ